MINSLVSVEVHRDPIITAVLVGRGWGGRLGQVNCGITRPMPWNPPRTEAPQPCWDTGASAALPLWGESVRHRVGFSQAESQVARGPQHRHLFAGIKLGKMTGPVGWRLRSKQRFGVRVHQLRGSGCITKVGSKMPHKKIAYGHVSGAAWPNWEPQKFEGDISEKQCLLAWGSQDYSLAQKKSLPLGSISSGSW